MLNGTRVGGVITRGGGGSRKNRDITMFTNHFFKTKFIVFKTINLVRSFVRKPSKSDLWIENLKRRESKLTFQRIGVAIHEKLSAIKHVT